MDLQNLTPGDAIVVELTTTNNDGTRGLAEREGTVISIANPDGAVGEWIDVEVIDIDYDAGVIEAVSDSRPGLDELYQFGDVLTVNVDTVRNGSAFVEIEPGRSLKIEGYPHHHKNIDVIVRSTDPEFLRCERFHQIDELSMAALVNTAHRYPCHIEFSEALTAEELNVFISHALAGGDWSTLKRLLRKFPDVQRVDFSTATMLLGELDDITPAIWRDILYTVVRDYPQFVESIGADYLGAILENNEIPRAWQDSVLGNTAFLLDTHDVTIRYTKIDIPSGSQQNATVSEHARYISTRTTEMRNSSINRELRDIWNERCSVCGYCAVSRHDKTGIEGSHIYPVQYGGPDKVGNILPMCRNHHWAFENGWIAISDNYTVLIHPDTPDSVRGLLGVEEDDNLYLVEGYEPDRKYVALHRRIHGFEPIQYGQQFPIKLKTLTEEGASVRFPDGTTLKVPMSSLGKGVTQFFTVRVTEVSDDGVRAVPQSRPSDD